MGKLFVVSSGCCLAILVSACGDASAQNPSTYAITPQPTLPADACGCATPQPAIAVGPAVPAPVVARPTPATVFRPLIPLAPVEPSYVAGRGILGQPKLYVPHQPVRNFIRYLSP